MALFKYTQTKSLDLLPLQTWIKVWFISVEMSIEINFVVL